MLDNPQLTALLRKLATKQASLPAPKLQALRPSQVTVITRATTEAALVAKLTKRLITGAAIVSRLPITATAPKPPKPKVLVPPRGKL